MIIAGTGHRPDKIGGYSPEANAHRNSLALIALARYEPEWVISGMALGWDTALAEAAVEIGVPFTAAVPFEGQESVWPQESRDKYRSLLDKASEVKIVCPGKYATYKMQVRNQWLVDNCDILLALWDGSPGGTGNCIKYAEKAGRSMINLWGNWMDRGLPLPSLEENHVG